MGGKKKKGFDLPGFMKKQPDAGTPEASTSSSAPASGANKRKSPPVLHETVFETVAGLCRKNKLFVVKRDDEDLYVGIYLNLDDIGGLSAKSKDESKGSMVSEINTGNISVMFNSELEAQNGLIFIPNATTIEHMMEYALLREGQSYALVLIDSQGDGDFEKTDVAVTLDYLKKCHDKKLNIRSKLTKYLEDVAIEHPQDLSNYGAAAQPAAPAANAVADEVEDGDEDEDEDWSPEDEAFGEEPTDFSGADMNDEEETFGDPLSEEEFEDGLNDEGGYGGYTPQYGDGYEGDPEAYGSGEEDEYGEGEEEEEIDYTVAREAVKRKFFNEDLSISIDTEALDQALSVYATFRPIDYQVDGSWMADLINPLIASANQELFDLHRDHLGDVQTDYLNKLEESYLDLMSQMQSPEVMAQLKALQEQYEVHRAGIPKMAKEKEDAAKADWEKKIHDAGEAARVVAEQNFRNKFQFQYEEQLRNITPNLQAELDVSVQAKRAEILNEQKSKLLQALDRRNNELVQEAVAAYKTLLPKEQELLQSHVAKIKAFMVDSRDEELARIRVLDDQLQHSNEVARTIDECNAKLAAVTSDFEARIAGLQADLEGQRELYKSDMLKKTTAYDELQVQFTQARDSWNSRANEYMTQMRELTEAHERDVKTRVDEMRAERDKYADMYEQGQKMQKHGYMMMIAIAIVACIAAAVIGVLFGMNMGGDKKADPAPVRPAISDVDDSANQDAAQDVGSDVSVGDTQGDGQGESGQTEPVVTPAPVVTDPVPQGGGDDDVPGWEDLQDPPLEIGG